MRQLVRLTATNKLNNSFGKTSIYFHLLVEFFMKTNLKVHQYKSRLVFALSVKILQAIE